MPRAVVPVLVGSEIVAVEQTKHVQRLFEKRLNALEYDQVFALCKVQVARLNCHIRYSIGIDDLHHGDHEYAAVFVLLDDVNVAYAA
jgi:hypothetical protein